MQYPENIVQAKQHATAALLKMQQIGIAPNPINFTVCYTCATGGRPDLESAVNELVDSGVDLSDDHFHQLYERFFAVETENEQISETSERIQGAVNRVIEYFETAQSDVTNFGDTMQGVSDQLSNDTGDVNIAEIVGSIVSETRQMAERSRQLEKQIAASSREIDTLRENLSEVRREAMTDQLTGLANRKCFDFRLRADTDAAVETDQPICLLIVDIDHFKKFNDTFGHQVGDKVLRTVGRSLKQGLKGRDTAARYGGEEFAVILPQTKLADGLIVAEQIRSGLAGRKIINRKSGEDYGRVTLSIGVAQLRPGEPLTSLIGRADEALYRAKGNGRNRVEPEEVAEAQLRVAN